MSKRFSGLVLAFALFQTAQASDPTYFHELERELKSSQARSAQRQYLVQDLQAQPAFDVEAYRFDLQVMPSAARLSGTLTAELVAKEESEIAVLDASDLEISAVWFIDSLGVRSEATFRLYSQKVSVSLPTRVKAGEKFSLTFAYSVIGDRRDGRHSPVTKGLFFVNADGSRSEVTPSIYTSVEPQLAPTWFPCLDHPSIKAKRVSMRISVPQGWTAVSNGALKSASDGTFEWEHSFPIATYLISLAISPYEVIEDKWRDVPLQYFVPRNLLDKARVDFARTPQMMEHFSSLWMSYPFEKYAMTTVPFYGGAMEHTTASTFSDGLVQGDGFAEPIVAHELAHHWWGNTVTNATWDDLWLNEGFATYSEILFADKFKGAEAAKTVLLNERKNYLNFDKDGTHAVVDPQVLPADKFTPAVYEKGAWVLHMLRNELGDELFFRSLNEYLRKFAFGNATTEDFRKTAEQVSGRDLSGFFAQWVYGKGYPDLSVSWKHDPAQGVTLEISQKKAFKFVLELVLAHKNEKGETVETLHNVQLSEARHSFVFPLSAGQVPVGVLIDPSNKVLLRARIARADHETRYWMTRPSWEARLAAVKAAANPEVSIELARDVYALAAAEPSAAARVAMLELLGHARKSKGITEADHEAVQQVLRKALVDGDSEVRVSAAYVSGAYLSPEFTEFVAQRFLQETSPRVKGGLSQALAKARYSRAFDLFVIELQRYRTSASYQPYMLSLISSFGILGDQRAAVFLVELVNAPAHHRVQRAALENLGHLAVPETFDFIAGILRSETHSARLRASAATSLANFGGLSAAHALNAQLKVEKNEQVKAAINHALAKLGGVPDLRRLLLQGSPVYLRW